MAGTGPRRDDRPMPGLSTRFFPGSTTEFSGNRHEVRRQPGTRVARITPARVTFPATQHITKRCPDDIRRNGQLARAICNRDASNLRRPAPRFRRMSKIGTRAAQMKSILDRTFRYVPSADTDLRKTFSRIRGEMEKAASEQLAEAAETGNRVVVRNRGGEFPAPRS